MKLSRSLAFVGSFVLLFAQSSLPATASASDNKITTGFVCHELTNKNLKTPQGTWGAYIPKGAPTTTAAYAANMGSVAMDVACPIIRDNPATSTGMTSLTMLVSQPTANTVSCIAYSVSATTGALVAYGPGMLSGAAPFQTLSFYLPNTQPDSNYFIGCRMGAFAGILSIRSEEN